MNLFFLIFDLTMLFNVLESESAHARAQVVVPCTPPMCVWLKFNPPHTITTRHASEVHKGKCEHKDHNLHYQKPAFYP